MAGNKRRMWFLGAVVAVVAAIAGVIPTPAQGDTAANSSWDFAADFGGEADEANPTSDSYGNAGVWAYMRGTPQSSAGYTLLDAYLPSVCNNGAVDNWADDPAGLPWAKNNRGGATACATAALGAGIGAVHPSGSEAAILRWTSPITGTVSVIGAATDIDVHGGNGVAWSIDKADTVIASGSIFNNSQAFASGTGGSALGAISVAPVTSFTCQSRRTAARATTQPRSP